MVVYTYVYSVVGRAFHGVWDYITYDKAHNIRVIVRMSNAVPV